MFKRYFWLPGIFSCLFAFSNHAASISWVAEDPNNDMNESANWDPNTVPGSSDNAIFDSTITNIDTNPTENSASFSISTFNFLDNASIFHFNFNNKTLTFNGAGVTGFNTNPTITVSNINNNSFAGDLISFLGSTGTSGSSIITSTNSGTLTGNHSNTSLGSFNSNLHSSGAFTIANNGSVTANNTAIDSANGTGNNGVANTGSSQLRFDQSFTAGDNVAVTITNSGNFSGNNTVQGDAVAIINGSQFLSSGAFEVGNNFNCEVHNNGNDSSHGVGLSNIGQINAAQIILQTTGTVGDNCTFTISNTGINSSETTSFSDFIGYLNDQQFFVGNTFQAGENFSLGVTNTGTDTSHGYGNYQVAVINSNSGTTGNQILFQQGCTLGDHAAISAANSGTYSGTNTNGGSNVAGMNLQQIAIGDSTSPGSYALLAGDYFTLTASNSGIDSSHGTGAEAVGDISTDQITLFTPVTLGNYANFTLTNTGNYSGNASSTYVNVGSAGGSQLNCVSSFSAEDNFTLIANNSGTNSGTGVGDFFVGDLITGQQVTFQDSFIVGNNASMIISNSGSNSSNTTSNNQVGSFMGYGKQLLAKNQFHVGDNFVLEITNSGFDNSTGPGGNFVGFMNNDSDDNSASQLHLSEGGTVGNLVSITLTNTGTYSGSNTTSGNLVAVLAGQQFYSVSDFQAGNNFALNVSNSGTDNTSGHDSNSVGTVGSTQVEFDGIFLIGNAGSIVVSNSGINNDPTGNFNSVGFINGSQLLANGNFTAGTYLYMSASNTAINEGSTDDNVGYLVGSQMVFSQSCTFNNGSTISAFNSGTVGNSQILFNQGFNVASGSVTIQAVNEGTLSSFGIDIEGASAGGNANIVLSNSILNIGTTLPTFTISSLVGDSNSSAQSLPQLIINTDASTVAEFFGSIQDYPENSSTLIKNGAGTQKLSGVNTYTGLTTVQEGILVVNGSLVGDVLTNSLGTLKGNGSIGGTFTNTGVVSPGESIGILSVGNYIENNGIYNVEVNGVGQSSRIVALGTATLNGGTVVVSAPNGIFKFQQPYTIVSSEGVDGTYTSVTSLAFIDPILTYDSDNVYLTLQAALSNAAENCLQYGVATQLDNITNPNVPQSLLISTIANLPLAGAQKALEDLSGFQYTDDVIVTNISTSRFLRRLYDPLRSIVVGCDRSCDEWTSWIETGYGYTNVHQNNHHKLNVDSYLVTGGIQKTFCHDLTFGLAGSYENDTVRYRDAKAERNSAFAGAYGLYRPCTYYGLFDVVYGYSSSRMKRKIDVGNLEYKARSKPNLNLITFYGEGGFDLDYNCALIQPFLGIQIGKNWRGEISENQSNGFGLKIKKHDWSTTSSRLGAHISKCNLCDCIDLSFDIAWNQLLSSRKNSAEGRFKEFGDSFRICGNELDNYSFDSALCLTTYFCQGLKGYFEVDGEWWEHSATYNVLAGIEFSW